jgi:hypothetical protein
MSRRPSGWILLTILIAAIHVSPSSATQVVHRTLRQLGEDAGLVVQGRVAGVASYWNDTHTKILTEARIEVAREWKGRARAQVRVVQMGGVVDHVKMTVHGALMWTPGEEVVLFLEPSLPDRFRVAGFSQGKFDVERDPRTGEVLLIQASPLGAEVVGAPKSGGVDAAASLRMPLEQLMDEALRRNGGR